MPTVEERLAALEARMAAWIDQQPTNYYTHQYSGEEIDAAVDRALTGGALDTSVTNVSNQLGTFTRPNLLDNWYFGNPVDQRWGMVVLQGTTVYRDAELTLTQGTVNEVAMPAYKVTSQAYSFVGADGVTYYVRAADVVRGYTGNGYTVDRWGILNNVTATLQNASLNIAYTESGWNLYTFLDNVLIPGTTYTLSCLYKASGNPIRLVCTWGTNKFFYNEQAPISDDWTLAEITGTIPADATIDINEIVVQSLGSGAGNFSLKAIKLELGSTQTLAHQENGVWVLNEVPEYGDQLRRCQRYQFEVFNRTFAGQGYLAQVKAIDSTQAYGVLPTPVTMRGDGIPALVTDCSAANPYGAFGIYSTGYSGGMGVITGISLFSKVQNGVILRAVGSNFVAGNDYQIWADNQNAHQFLLNYNL